MTSPLPPASLMTTICSEPTATTSSPKATVSKLSPRSPPKPSRPTISGSVLCQPLARGGRSAGPPLVISRKRTSARGCLISPSNQQRNATAACLQRQRTACWWQAPCPSTFADRGGDGTADASPDGSEARPDRVEASILSRAVVESAEC